VYENEQISLMSEAKQKAKIRELSQQMLSGKTAYVELDATELHM
jgi:hypothetical protein